MAASPRGAGSMACGPSAISWSTPTFTRTCEFCAGDMMRLQGHSDMGGIDAVFRPVRDGQARDARRPVLADARSCASSISHAYGKQDDVAMVEIFGARGQDLTYPEMKWWADHMQVCGVNFLIPHSFNPRSPNGHRLPALFLRRRIRAALAALSRVCRLHQPPEPHAHRRTARLPGGAAVPRRERPLRQTHPARANQREPPGRPLRLRLAAVRGV